MDRVRNHFKRRASDSGFTEYPVDINADLDNAFLETPRSGSSNPEADSPITRDGTASLSKRGSPSSNDHALASSNDAPLSPSLTSIPRAELERVLSSITETYAEQKQKDAELIENLQAANDENNRKIEALNQQICQQSTRIESLISADALAQTKISNLNSELLEQAARSPLPPSPKSTSMSPKLKEHEAKISAMTDFIAQKDEQVAMLMIANENLTRQQADLVAELEAEKDCTATLTKADEEKSNQIAILTLADEEKSVRIAELELAAELGESELIEHPTISLPEPLSSRSRTTSRGCFSLLSLNS